ncbi:MAG: ABC transporter substrate-binding protein, partial [Gammaproteobacteria bacterium]
MLRNTPTLSLRLAGGEKGWGFQVCLVIILLVFGLQQAGCAPQPRHSIRFGLATAPINLDPRYATDAVSDRIARLLFARLVDFDPHFQPIASLASWRALTPSHYRFDLGERWRRFHDGHRLTAKDVQATYASVLQGSVASPHRGALSIIQRIEVLDDDTVDFHLRRSDPLFPGRLGIGVLPEHLIAKNHPFNEQPVGSGPLKLISWPTPGRLVLERQADGQRIEFLTVQDPTVRVLKLLKGEIDLFQGDIPYELESWLMTRKEVRLSRVSGTTINYLGFNFRDPVVAEPLVRKAIAHAIDRDAIIRYVLK